MKIAILDERMENTQIKEWYKRSNMTSHLLMGSSGTPSMAEIAGNIERVRIVINEDYQLTMQELEYNFGIAKYCLEILNEDLQMVGVCAKLIKNFLKDDMKNFRVGIAKDNFLKTF